MLLVAEHNDIERSSELIVNLYIYVVYSRIFVYANSHNGIIIQDDKAQARNDDRTYNTEEPRLPQSTQHQDDD